MDKGEEVNFRDFVWTSFVYGPLASKSARWTTLDILKLFLT